LEFYPRTVPSSEFFVRSLTKRGNALRKNLSSPPLKPAPPMRAEISRRILARFPT
jgi:hypothetical protein